MFRRDPVRSPDSNVSGTSYLDSLQKLLSWIMKYYYTFGFYIRLIWDVHFRSIYGSVSMLHWFSAITITECSKRKKFSNKKRLCFFFLNFNLENYITHCVYLFLLVSKKQRMNSISIWIKQLFYFYVIT